MITQKIIMASLEIPQITSTHTSTLTEKLQNMALIRHPTFRTLITWSVIRIQKRLKGGQVGFHRNIQIIILMLGNWRNGIDQKVSTRQLKVFKIYVLFYLDLNSLWPYNVESHDTIKSQSIEGRRKIKPEYGETKEQFNVYVDSKNQGNEKKGVELSLETSEIHDIIKSLSLETDEIAKIYVEIPSNEQTNSNNNSKENQIIHKKTTNAQVQKDSMNTKGKIENLINADLAPTSSWKCKSNTKSS